jgi:hypothetical protein
MLLSERFWYIYTRDEDLVNERYLDVQHHIRLSLMMPAVPAMPARYRIWHLNFRDTLHGL